MGEAASCSSRDRSYGRGKRDVEGAGSTSIWSYARMSVLRSACVRCTYGRGKGEGEDERRPARRAYRQKRDRQPKVRRAQ